MRLLKIWIKKLKSKKQKLLFWVTKQEFQISKLYEKKEQEKQTEVLDKTDRVGQN